MPYRAYLDSGAAVSVIKRNVADTTNIKPLPNNERVTDVQGNQLSIDGIVQVKIQLTPDLEVEHPFLVAETLSFNGDILLGVDFFTANKAILNWMDMSFVIRGRTINIECDEESDKFFAGGIHISQIKPAKKSDLNTALPNTYTARAAIDKITPTKLSIQEVQDRIRKNDNYNSASKPQRKLIIQSDENVSNTNMCPRTPHLMNKATERLNTEKKMQVNKINTGNKVQHNKYSATQCNQTTSNDEVRRKTRHDGKGTMEKTCENKKRNTSIKATNNQKIIKETEELQEEKVSNGKTMDSVTVSHPTRKYEEKSEFGYEDCAVQITLAEEILVPPRHEVICNGRKKPSTDSEDVLICATSNIPYGILVGRSVAKASEHEVLLRMVNLTEAPILLPKKTVVGIASPVDVLEEEYTSRQNRPDDTKVTDLHQTNVVNAVTREQMTHRDVTEILEKINLSHLQGNDRSKIQKLLCEYIDVFQAPNMKLSTTHLVKHRIYVEDPKPIFRPPYRVPYTQRAVLQEKIDEMLRNDIIRPSDSPYSAPVILVAKRREEGQPPEVRLCIDFRFLNKISRSEFHPIPRLTDAIEALSGSRFFSTLDMASGYYQVQMDPRDSHLTAFSTPNGHFEFKAMPMGLKNSSCTFQRLVNAIFAGLSETMQVYLDDLIIYSKTVEEHVQRLEKVFIRMRESNLKFKPSKCKFLQSTAKFLGHIISESGCSPDPEKTKCVREYPRPKNVKHVRSFLGLVAFYRKFIKGFADIARPLTDLTKKDKPFIWEEQQETAFNTLKNALITAPVLAYPDFSKPFSITTDASGYAIAGVLSQTHEDGEHPVIYASRTLKDAERRYTTTERECLAVIYAVMQFRVYLLGQKFRIFTDHKSLQFLLTIKQPSSRLARWAMTLLEYEFDIIHKSGTAIPHADALSRAAYTDINNISSIKRKVTFAPNPEILPDVQQTNEDEEWEAFNNILTTKSNEWIPDKIHNIQGDLFNAPMTHSLAHCVAEDLLMSRGIAKQFKQIFGNVDRLRSQQTKTGHCAFLQTESRFIYYLVTKKYSQGKPTLLTLWNSLKHLRHLLKQHEVRNLAIPTLGCGLDALDWQTVKAMLNYLFWDEEINITVYHLETPEVNPSLVSIPAKTHLDDVDRKLGTKTYPLEVNVVIQPPGQQTIEPEPDMNEVLPNIETIWTREEIISQQRRDPELQKIYDNIKKEESTEFYLDFDGMLYRTRHITERRDKIVAPKCMVPSILKIFHESRFGAHNGTTKTTQLIQRYFYWKYSTTEIKKFCEKCYSCGVRRPSTQGKAPLQARPVPYKVFEQVAIDLVGPLNVTTNGNKYILTCIDFLTRYPEAIPIKDAKAETVAKAFAMNIIARHGCPNALLADRGSNFIGTMLTEVAKILQVTKTHTLAFSPSSNGIVERMHRTMKSLLAHYVNKSNMDWDESLPFILMAMRNQIHSTTGETPFFLLHGRDMILPFHCFMEPQRIRYDLDENYASELSYRLSDAWKTAREHIIKTTEHQHSRINEKLQLTEYNVGDKVYLSKPAPTDKGLPTKFQPKWTGPHRVIRKISPVTYKIREVYGKKEQNVHLNRLKPFKGDIDNSIILEPEDDAPPPENEITTQPPKEDKTPKSAQQDKQTEQTESVWHDPQVQENYRIFQQSQDAHARAQPEEIMENMQAQERNQQPANHEEEAGPVQIDQRNRDRETPPRPMHRYPLRSKGPVPENRL